MLDTFHGDHLAAFSLPNVDKSVTDFGSRGVNTDDIIDKWEAFPRVTATLRPEHRMGAHDISRGRKHADEKVVRVHLDGQDVGNENTRQSEQKKGGGGQAGDGIGWKVQLVRKAETGMETEQEQGLGRTDGPETWTGRCART